MIKASEFGPTKHKTTMKTFKTHPGKSLLRPS